MLPVPEVLKPVAPPDPVAVQLSELIAAFDVSESVTVAPAAVEGPLLDATIVYVIEVPGTAVPTAFVKEEPPSLSVLVMDRLAWELRESVSVAPTVEASGAEAMAVFVSVPLAVELTTAETT